MFRPGLIVFSGPPGAGSRTSRSPWRGNPDTPSCATTPSMSGRQRLTFSMRSTNFELLFVFTVVVDMRSSSISARSPGCATSAFIALLLACSTVQAQSLEGPALSVALGAIRNMQHDTRLPQFAAYPELEASFQIYRSRQAGITLGGGVYAAGWTDGVKQAVRCPHCVTYSYSSAIAGLRLAARLDHFPFPLTIWGGASYHALWADYVGGSTGYTDINDHEVNSSIYAVESGARLEIPISSKLRLQPRIHALIEVPFDENNPLQVRYVFAAGFGYVL